MPKLEGHHQSRLSRRKMLAAAATVFVPAPPAVVSRSSNRLPEPEVVLAGPHDLPAERMILGVMIENMTWDSTLYSTIRARTCDGYFCNAINALIFRKIDEIVDQRGRVDLATIAASFGPSLKDIGGPEYLAQLVTEAVSDPRIIMAATTSIMLAHMHRTAEDWCIKCRWPHADFSSEFHKPNQWICLNCHREMRRKAMIDAGLPCENGKLCVAAPPSHSPVLYAYALDIGGSMPRALLMPLLAPLTPRLHGTAATYEVEAQRLDHLRLQTIRRLIPIICERFYRNKALADQCAAVPSLAESDPAIYEVLKASPRGLVVRAGITRVCLDLHGAPPYDPAILDVPFDGTFSIVTGCANAYRFYASVEPGIEQIYEIGCEILAEMIEIGRQPEEVDAKVTGTHRGV